MTHGHNTFKVRTFFHTPLNMPGTYKEKITSIPPHPFYERVRTVHIVTKRGLKFWPRFVKMSSLLMWKIDSGPRFECRAERTSTHPTYTHLQNQWHNHICILFHHWIFVFPPGAEASSVATIFSSSIFKTSSLLPSVHCLITHPSHTNRDTIGFYMQPMRDLFTYLVFQSPIIKFSCGWTFFVEFNFCSLSIFSFNIPSLDLPVRQNPVLVHKETIAWLVHTL